MNNQKTVDAHIADAVAGQLERLAQRVRDGEVAGFALGWNGAGGFSGTLHRAADGRLVRIDMVVEEASATG